MKDSSTAITPGDGINYAICSGINDPCYPNGGTWMFGSAQPATVPPPKPGFISLFGNPTTNQIWKQPTGTTGYFYGNFDFTNATVTGVGGGGGGGGGNVASVFGRTGTITAQTGDYSVAQVTGAAPLASPSFTGTSAFSGTVTAPTPTNTDNSGKVATTAYVKSQGYGVGTLTGVATDATSGLQGGGTSGNLNISLIKTCASGQVLEWNGTNWVCANAGTGTITGVNTWTGSWAPGKWRLNSSMGPSYYSASSHPLTAISSISLQRCLCRV